MKKPKVAIVGGGVIGLSIASELLDQNWTPIIFAHLPLEKNTSWAAAAFTHPVLSGADPRIPEMFRTSLVRFGTLAHNPESGVKPTRLHIAYTTLQNADLAWLEAVPAQQLTAAKLPAGTKAGFSANVFQIEMEKYLPFLKDSVLRSGAKMVQEKIQLADLSDFDLVINASGIFARSLVPDLKVRAIRGQVVLVETPESLRRAAHRKFDVLMIEGSLPGGGERLDYIVFRDNDTLLGGTADLDDFTLHPRQDQTRLIIENCAQLVPELRGARKIGHKVGIRPFRTNLRLEAESQSAVPMVIHCYGHGGSGVTLSWGSAELVSAMAQEWWINEQNQGIKQAA